MALSVFVALFTVAAIGFDLAALRFGFSPQYFLAGGWRDDPLRAWLSPLISAFLARDVWSATFDLVFLLIAGRYVEHAIRPFGVAVIFLAGAYGGALARLLLTPGSLVPSAGLDAPVFALIGAYFMLYGVPRFLPIPQGHGRSVQIAMIAAIWLALQIVFAVVTQSFELSVTIVEPLGGLMAGVALARPLLAWTYRNA